MTSFARYKAVRLFPLLLTGGYFFVTIFISRLDSRPELFPFFNWSLFSFSSSESAQYALRVRSVDGQMLAQPRLYYDMTGTFAHARQRNINVSKVVQGLGDAVGQKKPQAADEMRRMIERRFMADVHAAEYDLVLLHFNPIDRLRTGAIKSERVVASYRKANE
jgi:hypothetical protein